VYLRDEQLHKLSSFMTANQPLLTLLRCYKVSKSYGLVSLAVESQRMSYSSPHEHTLVLYEGMLNI
jgi:hypothetical protein